MSRDERNIPRDVGPVSLSTRTVFHMRFSGNDCPFPDLRVAFGNPKLRFCHSLRRRFCGEAGL